MELLRQKSARIVNSVNQRFKRYLFNRIDWKSRLIIIKGSRGVGKTTLILQYLQENFGITPEALYVSLDDMYFTNNSLSELADSFVANGGKYLFIDEIHKYRNWSKELKNIYDFYPELKLIATGSSSLEIYKGEADLSRRATVYNLHEMSFREYLNLMYQMDLKEFSLTEVLNKHNEFESEINSKIKPIKYFNEYVQQGAYPFIVDDKAKFYEKLEVIINLILESDIPATTRISFETITKIKKLLYFIATSSPFKPNISELSKKINTSRDQLLNYLSILNKAGLIKLLRYSGIATSILTKPEKIYLSNTVLMFALDNRTNKGTLRETFFFNQLSAEHKVSYPKQGDFLIDDKYLFEVGGKNKTQKQIAGIKNAFVAADDIEYGFNNKIPLWLFGFLY